jgi:hypothetical protein
MTRFLARHCGAILILCVLPSWFAAQARTGQTRGKANDASGFTVQDMLDVVNIRAVDLSEDGRWVAATASTLRDRIGIDNSRYGDPTYIAPSVAEVLIIDTQTGKIQKLFPEKRQVRSMKWSPDGTRLALFVLRGELYQPMIWERVSGRFLNVPVPPGRILAENSELNWAPESDRVLLSLRSESPVRSTWSVSTPTARDSACATFTLRKKARTASGPRCGSNRKNTSNIPRSCSQIASRPRCC